MNLPDDGQFMLLRTFQVELAYRTPGWIVDQLMERGAGSPPLLGLDARRLDAAVAGQPRKPGLFLKVWEYPARLARSDPKIQVQHAKTRAQANLSNVETLQSARRGSQFNVQQFAPPRTHIER